jgi:hypothetical protein
MTSPPDLPISDLRPSLNGNLITPDDPGYDEARRVFFTGFDRRPAATDRDQEHRHVDEPVPQRAPLARDAVELTRGERPLPPSNRALLTHRRHGTPPPPTAPLPKSTQASTEDE